MIRDKNGNGNNGRAANPPDFRGSFPILKPILRIYEFVTKHPIFITVVCKKKIATCTLPRRVLQLQHKSSPNGTNVLGLSALGTVTHY